MVKKEIPFIGNQTGGRVFLFLSTDDFWGDYNDMLSKEIKFARAPRKEPYGAAAVFYIGYAVFTMSYNLPFYIALGLIAGEIIVLVVNSWKCPLTNVARKYSRDESYNFDIYLPRIVAQYNKEIFSVILAVILVVFIYQIISSS